MARNRPARTVVPSRIGRALCAAAALALSAPFAAPPAAAQATAQAEAGLRGVIASQIEAFGRDDFAAAFEFASPSIRSLFGTPENFGRMVRQGYPMVWRPGSWSFSTLEPEAGSGALKQAVVITDAAGKTYVADYYMVQVDGEWRINGVSLRPLIGAGA